MIAPGKFNALFKAGFHITNVQPVKSSGNSDPRQPQLYCFHNYNNCLTWFAFYLSWIVISKYKSRHIRSRDTQWLFCVARCRIYLHSIINIAALTTTLILGSRICLFALLRLITSQMANNYVIHFPHMLTHQRALYHGNQNWYAVVDSHGLGATLLHDQNSNSIIVNCNVKTFYLLCNWNLLEGQNCIIIRYEIYVCGMCYNVIYYIILCYVK